ncbi:MAG: hypothetical protein AAB601_00115, partial [Patescibacteria group bacterium]
LRSETAFLIAVERREDFLYGAFPSVHPRRIRAMLKKEFCTKPAPPPGSFTVKRYRRHGLVVRELDGGIVRRSFDPLFIVGGHHEVYDYVPKGELWLDANMDPKEMPYHAIHEAIEYKLMRRGVGYDTAHECAHAAEREARRRGGHGFPCVEDGDGRGTPLADFLLRLK